MSAYDLLRHRPEVREDELPSELSRVLCRCTGYRNIAAAVGDVAREFPDGVPEPLNCPVPAPVAPAAVRPRQQEITLPDGPPSVAVDVTSELSAPLTAVWGVLSDIRLLASCLPGAELTDDLGDDRYAGRAAVSLGPVRVSFRGLAEIVERDDTGHRLRVNAAGTDTGGAGTQARLTITATESATGTRLHAVADVYLTGRIAQFGRALAGDVGKRLFQQFARSVDHTATTGTAPATGKTGALGLLAGALRDWWARIRR